MNPNSAHQLWSLWEYTVIAPRPLPFALVKTNCARFGGKLCGSAAQMRIRHAGSRWTISVLAEGLPVHEAPFVTWVHAQWARFFQHGFGAACHITSTARLMAGSAQDGRPPDQLIIVPTITVTGEV